MSYHDTKSVVTGSIVVCHDRQHQLSPGRHWRRQSWHHGNSKFSVLTWCSWTRIVVFSVDSLSFAFFIIFVLSLEMTEHWLSQPNNEIEMSGRYDRHGCRHGCFELSFESTWRFGNWALVSTMSRWHWHNDVLPHDESKYSPKTTRTVVCRGPIMRSFGGSKYYLGFILQLSCWARFTNTE